MLKWQMVGSYPTTSELFRYRLNRVPGHYSGLVPLCQRLLVLVAARRKRERFNINAASAEGKSSMKWQMAGLDTDSGSHGLVVRLCYCRSNYGAARPSALHLPSESLAC